MTRGAAGNSPEAPSLADFLLDIAAAVAAVLAAWLPTRYWPSFPNLPIGAMAPISGLATLAVGTALAFKGFFAYAELVMQATGKMGIQIAERQVSGALPSTSEVSGGPMAAAMLAPFAFLFFTPLGQISAYLAITGGLRAIASTFDMPFGDPILTGVTGLLHRVSNRVRGAHHHRQRRRQEGPEVPDKLYPGDWAGLTGVDLVVVASRRKPEWDAGTFVLTPDKWFKLGVPYELQTPQGLRTIYPLFEYETGDVLRRTVPYELPPLQRRRSSSISIAATSAIAPPRSSPPDTAGRFK